MSLPITRAGIHLYSIKVNFLGASFDFPIVERCKGWTKYELDDWRALMIKTGLLEFLLEKTEMLYWDVTQKSPGCLFWWYCGIWFLGVVP